MVVVVVITLLYQTLSWFLIEIQTPVLKDLRQVLSPRGGIGHDGSA